MPTSTHLLSGGHKGAEAEFGRAAQRWGIEQTTLSFDGHDMEWPMGVRTLSDAELAKGDVSMEIVCRRMGRTYHEAEKIRRVVQSIFHMVNDSYQLFAIGWIQPDDRADAACALVQNVCSDSFVPPLVDVATPDAGAPE